MGLRRTPAKKRKKAVDELAGLTDYTRDILVAITTTNQASTDSFQPFWLWKECEYCQRTSFILTNLPVPAEVIVRSGKNAQILEHLWRFVP